MQIFLDTAQLPEIRRWLAQGVIDGVTTNPSILAKDGVDDIRSAARAIAAAIGDRPLSVEVTTNDLDVMLEQAQEFSRVAPNVVVKIPVINEHGRSCLEVVHRLEANGVQVNATAAMSFGQAMLAAKAGATFVSLFWGRIADEGHDAGQVVRQTRAWLDDWHLPTRIIAGSLRNPIDVQQAALAGAHVVTVPPAILTKLVDHKYSRHTAGEFVRAGEQLLVPARTV